MLMRVDALEWLGHLHHDSHPFFQSREAHCQAQPSADQLLTFLYDSEWKRTIARIQAAIAYSGPLGWDAAVERAWDEFPLATGDAASG